MAYSALNAYHNELSLRDVNMSASEEKELAWTSGQDVHNVQHICRYRTNVRYATNFVYWAVEMLWLFWTG